MRPAIVEPSQLAANRRRVGPSLGLARVSESVSAPRAHKRTRYRDLPSNERYPPTAITPASRARRRTRERSESDAAFQSRAIRSSPNSAAPISRWLAPSLSASWTRSMSIRRAIWGSGGNNERANRRLRQRSRNRRSGSNLRSEETMPCNLKCSRTACCPDRRPSSTSNRI